MVRKLVLSLIAILGAGALFVGAQNRQVSGTVSGPDGQPEQLYRTAVQQPSHAVRSCQRNSKSKYIKFCSYNT